MQGNKKEITCLKFQFGDECKYLFNLHYIAYPENFSGYSWAWHELMYFTELEP